MKRLANTAALLALTSLAAFSSLANAQQEGPTPTQAAVSLQSKSPTSAAAKDLSIKVNNRETPLTSLTHVQPTGAQVAILIDDGLRSSIGRQLPDLKKFIATLPTGTDVFVGYMQNGRVVPASKSSEGFSADHAAVASELRLPFGSPGISASPYFCLSDFVKKWPSSHSDDAGAPTPKTRFVLMITNGVDPYNGSTSPANQSSPYVDSAIVDAQRAAVAVYSIYATNAGFDSGTTGFSGQGYLSQIASATGAASYYIGTGNAVSFLPFFKQFNRAVAETYIATFDAPGGKDLVRIKLSSTLPGTKLHAPEQVRPGTLLAPNL